MKAFDISAVDAADVKQLDALFTLAPNKGPVRFGASFCLPSCCSASQKGSVMSASDQTHRDIRLRIARVVSLLEPIAQAQGPIIDPRDTYLSITLIVTELEAVLRKMRRDIFGHTNGNGDNGAMPHGGGGINMERKRDILTMLSTDPIAAAAQAVNQIETILGCVLELIDDVNVKMHPCGIYRHPAQRLADLQAAKDMLNRAIILHMATRWPTPADYDAAGEGP